MSAFEDKPDGFNDILGFYCTLINESAGPEKKVQRSWRLPSGAIEFFLRFYRESGKSLEKYDPRVLLLAALFLAGKVEENFVAIDELIAKINPKATPNAVLSSEVALISALGYDIQLHHAETCAFALLDGFITATPSSSAKNDYQTIRTNIQSVLALQRSNPSIWTIIDEMNQNANLNSTMHKSIEIGLNQGEAEAKEGEGLVESIEKDTTSILRGKPKKPWRAIVALVYALAGILESLPDSERSSFKQYINATSCAMETIPLPIRDTILKTADQIRIQMSISLTRDEDVYKKQLKKYIKQLMKTAEWNKL
jgi:hypothetical protein